MATGAMCQCLNCLSAEWLFGTARGGHGYHRPQAGVSIAFRLYAFSEREQVRAEVKVKRDAVSIALRLNVFLEPMKTYVENQVFAKVSQLPFGSVTFWNKVEFTCLAKFVPLSQLPFG